MRALTRGKDHLELVGIGEPTSPLQPALDVGRGTEDDTANLRSSSTK